MIRYMILASLLVMAACKSKTKTETTETGDKIGMDTSSRSGKDTSSVTTTRDMGKVDLENFGPIKLGQLYSEASKELGAPDTKSKTIEWAADGLLHEDWTWKSKGLLINMSSDKTNVEGTLAIYTITAEAPCNYKTGAGIGIGSSYAEVEAAYKKDIDPEATDKTQITAGSVYGGIIFSFKNDKVNKIFVGAEAE